MEKTKRHQNYSDLLALATERRATLHTIGNVVIGYFRALYDCNPTYHYWIKTECPQTQRCEKHVVKLDVSRIDSILECQSEAIKKWAHRKALAEFETVSKKIKEPKKACLFFWNGTWCYTKKEKEFEQIKRDANKWVVTSDLKAWLHYAGLTKDDIVKYKS